MKTQEKRTILTKEIQAIPAEFLDELAAFIQALKDRQSEKSPIPNQLFETLLNQTSEQYKEVWKALA